MFQRYVRLTLIPLLLAASSAWAADWQVETIEGRAKVQKGSVWTTLHLGDTVPNGAAIRTLADGSLELKRDAERIAMAPDTQIEIYERSDHGFTSVDEKFGTIGVEARIENVQHFTVRTPYLTANVKGTVFGVSTDDQSSAVSVRRGLVAVVDNANNVKADVRAGQSTVAGKGLELTVTPLSDTGLAAIAAEAADVAANPTSDLTAGASGATPDAAPGANPAGNGHGDAADGKAGFSNLEKVAETAGEAAVSGKKVDVSGLDKVVAAAGAGAAKGIEARAEKDDDEDADEASAPDAAAAASAPKPPESHAPKHIKLRKAAKAAPLLKVLFGTEAQYLWGVFLGLFLVYFAVGKILDLILRDVGFGAALNGLIALIGSLIGAFIRDTFFFTEGWYRWEPYVSIELIVGITLALLVAALVLRYRSLTGAAPEIKFSPSRSSPAARLQRR